MGLGFTGRQKKKCHKAPNMPDVIHRTVEQETGLSLALRIRGNKCSSEGKRAVFKGQRFTPVPLKEHSLVSQLFLVILHPYKITF